MKKNSLLLALSAALLLTSCGGSSESAKPSATGSSETSTSSASSEAKAWAPEDAALMKEHLLGVTLPYFSLHDTTVVFDEGLESILVTTKDVLGEGELAAYVDAFEAEGWDVRDVSAAEGLVEGAYYYATLPVKTNDGERILEALIYTAGEEGAPQNGGTLYVEASDPYVYDFPVAFISDIIDDFGSTVLPPVFSADYYEIEFQGMNYTTIRNNFLKFEDLQPETTYQFKLRAVNKDGHSEWNTFTAKTKVNPLEFAIKNIKGEISAKEMEGMEIGHLFDFNEGGDLWHTDYSSKAVPFDMIMDLNSYNTIDKFQYLPRTNAGAGTILKGSISYSMDKKNWTEVGSFEWGKDNETKEFIFQNQPEARYIKMHITEAVRDFGSGRELYVFKKPGTESAIPGDINHDNKIDSNDLMGYMNYNGLRKGDKDYEGYISRADINRNGVIDAYDISSVGIYLEDGISHPRDALWQSLQDHRNAFSHYPIGDSGSLTPHHEQL